LNGYTLSAGTLVAALAAKPADAVKARRSASKDRKGGGSGKGSKVTKGGTVRESWRLNIPITGKAIAMAGDVVFVAGEPMEFKDPSYENYVASYNGKLGGQLLAVSASDGRKLAEYKLASAPAWDGIAAANGSLYISGVDGSITCFSER
jgi:outer membrane protein assembly factor BamB